MAVPMPPASRPRCRPSALRTSGTDRRCCPSRLAIAQAGGVGGNLGLHVEGHANRIQPYIDFHAVTPWLVRSLALRPPSGQPKLQTAPDDRGTDVGCTKPIQTTMAPSRRLIMGHGSPAGGGRGADLIGVHTVTNRLVPPSASPACVTSIAAATATSARSAVSTSATTATPQAGARAVTFPMELDSGGDHRSAIVHVPALPFGTSVPLLVVLHGAGSDAARFEAKTGFDQLADLDRFIVVYPDGVTFGSGRTWNAGQCCPPASTAGVDDVAFISALLDRLEATYPVDVRRVYAVGHSNGAMSAQRLGCEAATRSSPLPQSPVR